jgi:hypothetical protein
MGSELWLHHVAGVSAKLNGLHVFHCPIGELASNDYIQDRRYEDKDSKSD